MRRLKNLIFAGGLVLASSQLGAQEGAPYLLTAEGVHAAALAGAFGAYTGSPEALWYNPGALTDLNGVELSLSHLSFPGAYDSDHLVLAAPLNWTHHFGLIYHQNSAEDTYRDNLGNETGNFQDTQTVIDLGYSYRWKDLSLGAAYKSLNESLEKQSGSSSVVDLGSVVELNQDAVVFGAALQNIGSAPSLGSGGPAVEAPLLARASVNLRFNTDVSRWQLLGDYNYALVSSRSGFSLGVDYSEEYQGSRLGLRAGWDFSQSALGGAAGLALGAGYGYGPVGLDYAFTPREALGNQHRIALTLLWDLRAKSQEKDLAGYLGPEAAATPQPTPTPVKAPALMPGAGAALDALLAATPSPTPVLAPTPVVEEKHAPSGGILGALAKLFSFGSAPSESGEAGEKPAGILGNVFKFLGFGSSAPTEAPESPQRGQEDAVANGTPVPLATPTPLVEQRLKGDSVALPPTPVPTPIADKVKGWMKF